VGAWNWFVSVNPTRHKAWKARFSFCRILHEAQAAKPSTLVRSSESKKMPPIPDGCRELRGGEKLEDFLLRRRCISAGVRAHALLHTGALFLAHLVELLLLIIVKYALDLVVGILANLAHLLPTILA
jgi:hypothetical protein